MTPAEMHVLQQELQRRDVVERHESSFIAYYLLVKMLINSPEFAAEGRATVSGIEAEYFLEYAFGGPVDFGRYFRFDGTLKSWIYNTRGDIYIHYNHNNRYFSVSLLHKDVNRPKNFRTG